MKGQRPVNLHVTSWFPITAIVSILHRLSGVALYVGIAVLLWLLDASLESKASFLQLQSALDQPLWKIIVLLTVFALIYHLVAGIRHLLMDFGYGEGLKSGRLGAQITIGVSVILSALAGVWLW